MPNGVSVFGSASHVVDLSNCEASSEQTLYIKKFHLKAIDQPTQRCSAETNLNTSACIADYVEREIGCNPDILGTQYSKGLPCRTKSQLLKLRALSHKLSGSDDNDVYNMTGCLAACKKDIYSFIAEPMTCRGVQPGQPTLYGKFFLKLTINDRSYEEREEYIIYDIDSFIADVGGYMGLLLGCSFWSLYNEIEALIKRLVYKPLFCDRMKNGGKK